MAASSWNVDQDFNLIGVVPSKCKCVRPMKPKERTGWQWDNPGRRFWNCAKSLSAVGGCNFFRWKDEELAPGYYKELIYDLKQQLNARTDNIELGRCRCKIRQLESENEKLVEQLINLEVVVAEHKHEKEQQLEVMAGMMKRIRVLKLMVLCLVVVLVMCLLK